MFLLAKKTEPGVRVEVNVSHLRTDMFGEEHTFCKGDKIEVPESELRRLGTSVRILPGSPHEPPVPPEPLEQE